jgi:hypothetical protein
MPRVACVSSGIPGAYSISIAGIHPFAAVGGHHALDPVTDHDVVLGERVADVLLSGEVTADR